MLRMRFYFVPTNPFKSSVLSGMHMCVLVVVIENVSFDRMHGLVTVCFRFVYTNNTREHTLKLQLKFDIYTDTNTLATHGVYGRVRASV